VVTLPGLSADERAVLQSGQPVTAGVGTLVVQAARQLLSAANPIAALSAEALQAQVRLACSTIQGAASRSLQGRLLCLAAR
jgi:histidine ammonia-lyase